MTDLTNIIAAALSSELRLILSLASLSLSEDPVSSADAVIADTAKVVADAIAKARTITTTEQLESCPDGTVVRDAEGRTLVGNPGPDTSHLIPLPATVLWLPEPAGRGA